MQAGQGKCRFGQAQGMEFLSHSSLGRLGPRIWRRCEDYVQSDTSVRCVDCRYLAGDYCRIAEYPVTGKDKAISCGFFKVKMELVD